MFPEAFPNLVTQVSVAFFPYFIYRENLNSLHESVDGHLKYSKKYNVIQRNRM